MKDKFILDACCGCRMFWFNKKHPNAIFIDRRERERKDLLIIDQTGSCILT
jgi:hypothetical protein